MKTDSIRLIGGANKGLRLREKPAEAQAGNICVSEGSLQLFDTGWNIVAPLIKSYDFTSHTFTAAGVIGANGPTLAQLRTAYAAAAWAQNDAYFTTSDGIQKWFVPQDGKYRIVVLGTMGLTNDARMPRRSKVIVEANLKLGDVLSILVGQRPKPIWVGGTGDYAGCTAACAPGATFVESRQLGLLCVAGGIPLRGANLTDTYMASNGTPGYYMNVAGQYVASTVPLGQGGLVLSRAGPSGGALSYAGGGGGYLADGGGTMGGKSFKNGGKGGIATTVVGNQGTQTLEGGFGGGGAGTTVNETIASNRSSYSSAGAGGYTGGNGSVGTYGVTSYMPGIGGNYTYNYPTGSIEFVAEAMNVSDGTVQITRIG